jgi:hypothetical protein
MASTFGGWRAETESSDVVRARTLDTVYITVGILAVAGVIIWTLLNPSDSETGMKVSPGIGFRFSF